MAIDYQAQLRCAIRAAHIAGEYLRECFHTGVSGHTADIEAEQKIRDVLRGEYPDYGYLGEELRRLALPGDAEGHLWLVDPDDGTSAFDAGFRGAAVSLALLREGVPVLGVVYAYCAPDDNGDLITWAEGQRLERNGNAVRVGPDGRRETGTILVAHGADRNSRANAALAAPLRFRAMASIAYRLALVAAGEADATISVAGPVSWDYGAGHALLRGAGMDLVDARGAPVVYGRDGSGTCGGTCIGGLAKVAAAMAAKNWGLVLKPQPSTETPYSLCWPKRGVSVRDPALLSRAQGCWLGQLAGDSLGSLVEFESRTAIAKRYPHGIRSLEDGGTWNTLAGQPTDDSELALMLARSILQEGEYRAGAAATAYGWWYRSGPFDMGNATRRAMSAAAAETRLNRRAAASAQAADRETEANGALMRSSPLGIVAGGGGAWEECGKWARLDSALSHPSAVCQGANQVFVEAIGFAIATGEPPAAVHAHALRAAQQESIAPGVRSAVEAAATAPPADYQHQMGWVRIALQNAFWQLLHAGSLEDGVIGTVMAGGDTDTNAAIAGALLGSVYGRESVPEQWRDRILCCRPLQGLAGVHKPRPAAFWPVDALNVAERLLCVGRDWRNDGSARL